MGLIVGNLFSLFGMVADGVSSSRKTARGMLLVQCLGQLLYSVSAIALKGYSAAVQNVVSILRNLLASSKFRSKTVEWCMVVLAVILGLLFNNLGLIGVLPVVANLEYTLAVFRFRDNERSLKIAFLICVLLYTVFNVIILNIVGAASNVVVAVMTISALIKMAKSKPDSDHETLQ